MSDIQNSTFYTKISVTFFLNIFFTFSDITFLYNNTNIIYYTILYNLKVNKWQAVTKYIAIVAIVLCIIISEFVVS